MLFIAPMGAYSSTLTPSPTPAALNWSTSQATAVLTRIDTAAARQLLAHWQTPDPKPQLQTQTTALLMQHIAEVSGNPQLWRDKAERYKLARALRDNRIERYLQRMEAANPVERGLKVALIRYMDIESRGGWPVIPDGEPMQQGSKDPRLPLLRQRLIASSDLSADADDTALFDPAMTRAVQRFQRRHGLPQDGVVGPSTRREMNVPVHQRIAAIRLSRARAQALPSGSRANYLWVNIPGAYTELVRNQQTIWSSRAVVGKVDNPTPEIESAIETLVLNPYWLVPQSIAERKLLPRAARDPGFLRRMRYSALDASGRRLPLASTDWRAVAAGRGPSVRLMQSPGPHNALGKVKFLFPNKHAVYLHDTPSKQGFSRPQRTLSNGCVRVEGALSLAAMLLEPQGWDQRRIEAALSAGEPVKLTLQDPVPVHTLYLTATPGTDGEVNFHRDSYRLDTPSALAQLN